MRLNGLHLLLTYQCTFECDHCFVWSSPFQTQTMTLNQIRYILNQALKHATIEWIYFEGGEPTLYYPILLQSVQDAKSFGFKVGIVSNTFWANNIEDAITWLTPLRGLVEDFSISSDLYHFNEQFSQQAKNTQAAAEQLGIPLGIISIAQPNSEEENSSFGQLPEGTSSVMYRGRAAQKLADRAQQFPWDTFRSCPFEDLRDPGRIHIDPEGHLQICQGISIGNIFEVNLETLCEQYDPNSHPITEPLINGGPVELVKRYGLSIQPTYADACHLCYSARLQLRNKFPQILVPDQVYGLNVAE